MLSRVAENIYWMNRYIERAENYARFMDVNFNLSLDLPPDISEQWKPLIVTTGDWPLFESLYDKPDKSKVIFFLGFDAENPNSIWSCTVKARENARSLRPEITKEVWEQINHMYYFVKDGVKKKYWKNTDPREFFVEFKQSCQLLYGILNTTISKTEGWHFGKMGQLIERADKTSRILDVKYHMLLPGPESVGSPLDLVQWSALLKSVSAYDMYRKIFGKLTPLNISEFLIFDTNFPRSMLSCIRGVESSLNSVSTKAMRYANDAEKKLGIMKSQMQYSDINDVFALGLHEYLDNFQQQLNEVSGEITKTFFSPENILKESRINPNQTQQ